MPLIQFGEQGPPGVSTLGGADLPATAGTIGQVLARVAGLGPNQLPATQWVGGVTISGTPVAGQSPIASSATAAVWGFPFTAAATVQNNGAASVLTQGPSTLAAIPASRIALGHTQLTLPAAAPINLRAQVTAIGAVACGVSIVQTGDRVWDVYTVEAAGGADVDANYFVRFDPLV
jgi:hypothetical protein